MREMEQLSPDQRAVLSLVLSQEKSYAEVASVLGVSEQSVRERAHAALDALAAQGAPPAQTRASANRPSAARGEAVPAPTAEAPLSPRAARRVVARPSSKTGGAILLGAILAAIVAAGILLSSGGGKGSGQPVNRSSGRSTASSSSTPRGGGTGGVQLDKQLTLAPPAGEPSSRASGEGIVVSKGNSRAFYVKAHGLPPSSGFFYAVWLYNSSSDSYPLGRTTVSSNGVLEGGGPLAAPNLGSFHKLVITRETSQHPSAPGPIVLSAPFALH